MTEAPSGSSAPASPPPFSERLSQRYEDRARRHPRRYRLQLAGLALLGQVYVAGVAAMALALGALALSAGPAGVVWMLVCAFIAFRLMWAFWIRRQDPLSVALDGESARAVRARIERLRSALGCPAPRRILVGLDCGAAVDARAWGRDAHTLVIGLPLLLSLPVQELDAVLAHELGHIASAHGRFGAWIHHVRSTWEKLGQTVATSGGPVTWLLNVFAGWFWPRFGAASLVRVRQFERQADRDAVDLAGAGAFAAGLARTLVVDARLDERFWQPLALHAADEPEPTGDVCERMAAELAVPDTEEERRLAHALGFRTMYWDTHPSLSERIAAVGTSLDALPPVEATAAEALLGPELPGLMRRLDEAWLEAMRPRWKERHDSLQAGRARVAALESGAPQGELDVEDEWERATWTEELQGPEAALPLYRALLDRAPEHRGAQLALGRVLLLRNDAAGLELVEASLADPWLVMPATELLYHHYASRQLHDQADHYHRLAAAHGDRLDEAGRERSALTRSDRAEPHGLGEHALERVRKQLRERTDVAEAYLVRKVVRLFPEKPCLVLGVRERLRWYQPSTPMRSQKLVQGLAESVRFPEPLLVVNLDQDRGLFRKVQRVEGSRILPA